MASISHGERKGKKRSCSLGKDLSKKIDFLRSSVQITIYQKN